MKNKIYIKDIDKHKKKVVCHIVNGSQFNKLNEFYPLKKDLSYPHYQIVSSTNNGYSYDINDYLNEEYLIIDYNDIVFIENDDDGNTINRIIHILNDKNAHGGEKLHKIKKIVQQYEE